MSGRRSPGRGGSRLGLRAGCRMVLGLLRDADLSLPFSPDLARGLRASPRATPRCCLDLSDLSGGEEMTVFRFALSPGRPEPVAGWMDSPGPQDGLESQRQCLRSLPVSTFSSSKKSDLLSGRCGKSGCTGMLAAALSLCLQMLSPVSVPSCPFQPQVRCSTPGTMYCESSEMASPLMSMAKEGGWFKHPGWHVSKPLLFHKEVMDPLSSSTPPLDVRSLESEMADLGSPIAETESCAHGTTDHLDSSAALFPDEQEDMEIPVAGNQSSSMAVLLSGPLLMQDINVSEVSVNRSRLYRFPSMPEKLDRPALKRIVRGQDNETPVKVKRRCSLIQEEPEGGATLKKTASLSDMEITKILDQDHGLRQLIGDFSKVYALPTVTGRHQDLQYIIPETVAALLSGQFQSLIEMFYIIDCRYPYEYLGGHIKGALNLHRQEDLFELFLKRPLFPSMPQKRIVLVFHCEFSSERGPKMCRYLREEDRAMNEYPALHYPEMYVLKGGYKEFFPEYKELCEPQSYCPMHHQDFKTELLKFRTKSKSWVGERKRRDQITRLMKL